jgi:hypothetical protein
MKTDKLSKNELKELVGGLSVIEVTTAVATVATINDNVVSSCSCPYKNKSVINNINRVAGCVCTCV